VIVLLRSATHHHPIVIRVVTVDGNTYRYVYNGGTGAAAVGYGVVMSAVSGYTCVVSSTINADLCVGVVRNAILSASAYGWVLTEGFSQVQMASTVSCAAGDMLVLGTAGAFIRQSLATDSALAGRPIAKAMQAIASNASGTAWITI